jgi:hypothetical protein
MRRWRQVWAAGLAAGTLSAAAATPKEMSVQTAQAQFRATPSFLAPVTGQAAYGDRLQIIEERTGWIHARAPSGKTGWMHASALTKKRIVLQAGQGPATGGASGEEVALAGKGFNKEVESAFRRQNPSLDFSWVDRMELFRVTPAEATQFLSAGGLQPAGGDAP